MSKAFILLNCDLDTETPVITELLKIDGVSDAYKTHGVYDIIVKLNSDSEKLKSAIMNIRRISYVRSSLTLLVTEQGDN
jgi:hypothetical protein